MSDYDDTTYQLPPQCIFPPFSVEKLKKCDLKSCWSVAIGQVDDHVILV